MNTQSKQAFFLIPLLVVALAMGVTASAAAEAPLPFKGSIDATDTVTPGFPIEILHGIGSGHATLLGRYTVTYHTEVNLSTGAGFSHLVFVAANGDTILAEGPGQFTLTEFPFGVVVETHTITGGTGRFAGATGSIVERRVYNLLTHASAGTFDGNIVTP